MTPEKDAALVRDFPNLYIDRHASKQVTCRCWGLHCGDGWEPLIRELSAKLEAMICALPTNVRGDYRATQVREWMAVLDFKLSKATPEMQALIDEAVDKSERTCDMCGAPGCVRSGSWLRTRCDRCTVALPQPPRRTK
jgi:nicotinamide mononucleotide adenylyltransferase